MGPWLIALVTLAYLGVAWDFWLKGSCSMAVVYIGYSLSNVGFFWVAMGWGK